MKILASLILAINATVAFGYDFTATNKKPVVKTEVVAPSSLVADVDNTVVLYGEFDSENVSKWIYKINTAKSDNVLIYIKSPGGSIPQGLKLIDFLLSTNKKTTCFSSFAASMAFATFQACTERVVNNSSIIMQHQASFGMQTNAVANNLSFLGLLTRMIDMLSIAQAKRIGMSLEKFNKTIHDDWWLIGKDAVTANTADKLDSVTCTERTLKGTFTESVRTFFGTIHLTWSQCPLIEYPVDVRFGENVKQEDSAKALNEINNIINFPKNAEHIRNINK